MYPNWKAEMARYNITCNEIGNVIGKKSSWIENRLQGKAFLPVDFAITIRNSFFKDLPYEYLFSNSPQRKHFNNFGKETKDS